MWSSGEITDRFSEPPLGRFGMTALGPEVEGKERKVYTKKSHTP